MSICRKEGGRFTEPSRLPPKLVVFDRGVDIEHYYHSGDHGPPHLHVIEGLAKTRIGQNGYPLRYNPPMTARQTAVVTANLRLIRKAIRRIGRWHWFNNL